MARWDILKGQWKSRQVIDANYLQHSDWIRCVGLIDLISLAIGVGLAPTVFVFIPNAIRSCAGPSTVLSIIIAFASCTITGLHHTELCLLFPKAGGVCSYAHILFGELFAFAVGLQTIFDAWIAAAFAAQQWSQHFRILLKNSTQAILASELAVASSASNTTGLTLGSQNLSLDVYNTSLSVHLVEFNPDYLAIGCLVAVAVLMLFGMRVVCLIVLIQLIVCILILCSVLLVGLFYADIKNWPAGSYFSGGAIGISAGAARILIGHAAADALFAMIEEIAISPRHLKTLSPCLNLANFSVYLVVTFLLTLMVPFTSLPSQIILPTIYGQVGIQASRYVVAIASVCGLGAAVICLMASVVRPIQALSECIIRSSRMAHITKRYGVPLFGLFLTLLATALLSCFNIEALVDILSITVPLRQLLVISCVLWLRLGLADADLYQEIDSVVNQLEYCRLRVDAGVAATTSSKGFASGSLTSGISSIYEIRSGGTAFPNYDSMSESTVLANIAATGASFDSSAVLGSRRNTSCLSTTTSASNFGFDLVSEPGLYQNCDAAWNQPHGKDSFELTMTGRHSSKQQQHLDQVAYPYRNSWKADSQKDDSNPEQISFSCLSRGIFQAASKKRWMLVVFVSTTFTLLQLSLRNFDRLANIHWYLILLEVIMLLASLISGLFLGLSKTSSTFLTYKSPAVPWLSMAGIAVLLFTLVGAEATTWLLASCSILLGHLVYAISLVISWIPLAFG